MARQSADGDNAGWFKNDTQRAAVITGTLALIAALVAALIAALVTRGSVVQTAGSGTSGPAPVAVASAPAPTYVQASPLMAPGEAIAGNDYTIGMCFNFSKRNGFDVLDYEPCDSDHNGQIVAMFNASGSPSPAAASTELDMECQDIVANLPKPSDVEYRWYLQVPDDYLTGDRAYQCFALTSAATDTSLITW